MELGAVVYDLLPLIHPRYFPKSDFAQYACLLASADRLSCISAQVKGKVEKYLRFLDPAVSPSLRVHELAGDFSIEPHMKPQDSELPIVLCVGTIEPRKNHRRLLWAARHLWKKGVEFELIIAGRWGWMVDDLSAELRAAQASGFRVRMLENPTDEQLQELYSKCRFTIFPSLDEGFGLPIQESVRFAKPVICSRFGSMAEIAVAGGCLTVDPSDIVAIANGLESLLKNEGLYQDLVRQTLAIQHKTWQNYAENLKDFFSGSPNLQRNSVPVETLRS